MEHRYVPCVYSYFPSCSERRYQRVHLTPSLWYWDHPLLPYSQNGPRASETRDRREDIPPPILSTLRCLRTPIMSSGPFPTTTEPNNIITSMVPHRLIHYIKTLSRVSWSITWLTTPSWPSSLTLFPFSSYQDPKPDSLPTDSLSIPLLTDFFLEKSISNSTDKLQIYLYHSFDNLQTSTFISSNHWKSFNTLKGFG